MTGIITAQAKTEQPDPELSALREAERILFPRPVDGITLGIAQDWPHPVAASGPHVFSSGVPPRAPLGKVFPEERPSRRDAEWLKSLVPSNLPQRLDARVVKFLKFYRDNPKGRGILRVWARRSGRFTPAMQSELAQAGLPTDLVWLSLVESGHKVAIRSQAGAVGLWQLIPETARLYGLTVDRWVDERLDPQRSTAAAILFLKDLYQRFGTWELAMAAYNMGFAGLSSAMRKYNTNDFWELGRYEAGIPWETTLYVPRVLAMAIVMNNRRAFGIADVEPDAPVAFDTILVRPGISLARVANAASVALFEIELLNPQYLASRTPPPMPGGPLAYPVYVPVGQGPATAQALAAATDPDAGLSTYLVRFGDTAESVAGQFGVAREYLVQLNALGDGELLTAGTVLLVPKVARGRPRPSAEPATAVVRPLHLNYPGRRRVFFRTRPGDTLASIAEALGTSTAELFLWNALDPEASLQAGMVLQAFVPDRNLLDGVRHFEEHQVRTVLVGSDDFFDYFEGRNGRRRVRVVVQMGETLRSIGRRYGMSVGWMERVNRRADTDPLLPGETVVVYARPSTPIAHRTEGIPIRALPPLERPILTKTSGGAEKLETSGPMRQVPE